MGVLGLAALGWQGLHGRGNRIEQMRVGRAEGPPLEKPDFYREYGWDPAQRSLVSQRALDKLLAVQNLAAAARAAEKRALLRKARRVDAIEPVTVCVTEEEINAFFQHNAGMLGWERDYEPYVAQPVVYLRDGQVILSAEVHELGCILSLRFAVALGADGRLQVRLVEALGGRRPLPPEKTGALLERIRAMPAERMDLWRQSARMDRTGQANSAAASAAFGRLILGALGGNRWTPCCSCRRTRASDSSRFG